MQIGLYARLTAFLLLGGCGATPPDLGAPARPPALEPCARLLELAQRDSTDAALRAWVRICVVPLLPPAPPRARPLPRWDQPPPRIG